MILLRLSSAIPCGVLLYLGDFWAKTILELLSSIPVHKPPFGPEVLAQIVGSGFFFIILVLFNQYIVNKHFLKNSLITKKQISSFEELWATSTIVAFFLAFGGMHVVHIVIIFSVIVSFVKILVKNKAGGMPKPLVESITIGEKVFWSIITKERKRTHIFLFYETLAASGIILALNLGFFEYESVLQIFFLAFPIVAAILSFFGIKREWSKPYQIVLPYLLYVGAFLFVVTYPKSMPFNLFLYNSLLENGIAFSTMVLYTLPLVVFTILFGLFASTILSVMSEENKSNKVKHFALGYTGSIIAFFAFAMVFEFLFMPSIYLEWARQDEFIRELDLSFVLSDQTKIIMFLAFGSVLFIGAIFYAAAGYNEPDSSDVTSSFQIRDRVKLTIVLFLIFFASSIGFSSADKHFVGSIEGQYNSGILSLSWIWNLVLLIPHLRHVIRL